MKERQKQLHDFLFEGTKKYWVSHILGIAFFWLFMPALMLLTGEDIEKALLPFSSLGIILFPLLLYFIISPFTHVRNIMQTYGAEEQMYALLRDFETGTSYMDGTVRVGEKFILLAHRGRVYKISDLVGLYPTERTVNFVTRRSLTAMLESKRKPVTLCGLKRRPTNEEMEKLLLLSIHLHAKNPEVVVGYKQTMEKRINCGENININKCRTRLNRNICSAKINYTSQFRNGIAGVFVFSRGTVALFQIVPDVLHFSYNTAIIKYGILEMYSLDEEEACDSHYQFRNESGLRQSIYAPGG